MNEKNDNVKYDAQDIWKIRMFCIEQALKTETAYSLDVIGIASRIEQYIIFGKKHDECVVSKESIKRIQETLDEINKQGIKVKI